MRDVGIRNFIQTSITYASKSDKDMLNFKKSWTKKDAHMRVFK